MPGKQFGASEYTLESSNYKVHFTPKKEYLFVADSEFTDEMEAGLDPITMSPIVNSRTKVDVQQLLKDAVPKIHALYTEMGWSTKSVTPAKF
eukprot:SAG11_NODE_33821_length_275_cov_0.590909_1_plen_91_part_11